MSNVVPNPNLPLLTKEMNAFAARNQGLIRSLNTDWRIVRDEYGDIVAFLPRIHCVFKDESDFIMELSGGETHNVH